LNGNGQLGLGDTTDRLVPTQVGTDTDWEYGDVGYFHTLGLKAGGLYTWGYNNNGQLGDGTTTDASSPVSIW
jgi:alpha-tubulin suppressor-like RCC1 family protein